MYLALKLPCCELWETLYRKLQISAKIIENTCREPVFGKVADSQTAILLEKWAPLQIFFN